MIQLEARCQYSSSLAVAIMAIMRNYLVGVDRRITMQNLKKNVGK